MPRGKPLCDKASGNYRFSGRRAALAGGGNTAAHHLLTIPTLIKKNQIFLISKKIQNGAVAKSYMTNGLLIYGKIFPHFLIY